MSAVPITARREIRLAVVAALKNVPSATDIDSPGDWTTQLASLPAIQVRAPRGSKEPLGRGAPSYTSVVLIEIETKVVGKTGAEAQDLLESFDAEVEVALLTNHNLVAMTQQMSFEIESEINAEGRHHYGGSKWSIRCEVAEMFDPIYEAPSGAQPVAIPFQGMDVHADLANVYDPTRTYPNAAFSDAVKPAPRSAGPDGRDEGGLSINFPQ
ncbi:hypothetical protein HH213_17930 [Duganella dendranthematis]|uniref:Uncharacterized protein n=1 Tax=Duganella dendranthematis TaxID=2728021 RepID=A0ABX6MFU5_9BURK|nr:hypothetical protein [Duganella dendranthematis]QJD91802.1 hypothetical protein HH213_17930 [Duganella dendranthematis]